MLIGFVAYEGMTLLDLVGAYDSLARLRTMGFMPELHWEVVAPESTVTDGSGMEIVADAAGTPLSGYDMIYVPGGMSTRHLMHDSSFLAWLSTAESCPLKVSVCTGALLLGAAGFLRGKKATTHPGAFHLLEPFCSEVLKKRLVDEGDVITAGSVTASIDLGLYMVSRIAGRVVASKIREQMDYRYVMSDSEIYVSRLPPPRRLPLATDRKKES
ncbi:MAG: DJ-1/PfpI family protein [Bacillota bacterium]